MIAALLLWCSVALVVYTFLGYPLLLGLLARLRPMPPRGSAPDTPPPEVCVIIAASNEEARIAARVENVLQSDYPAASLRVLVVSDGSTDATAQRVLDLHHPRVGVLEQPERAGKAACLNAGAEAAGGSEILVFADARQRFAPDAIAKLVAKFSDPSVGAVSGALEIERSGGGVGSGVDSYWRLEKWLRAAEARWDSAIGCTGAIYAIRRGLFHPIPADTILDDVVIPMHIAAAGKRVLFEPEALAHDPQPLDPRSERVRKRRTLAGNFQMLLRYPGWLLPWRHRLWWQLLSHKYLRVFAPLFLLVVFVLNALLAAAPARPGFYCGLLLLQLAFYVCALAGIALPMLRLRVFAWPAGFVFLNAMSVRGFIFYLRNRGASGWETPRR